MSLFDSPDTRRHIALIRKAIQDHVDRQRIDWAVWLETNLTEGQRGDALLGLLQLSIEFLIDVHGEAEAGDLLKLEFDRIVKKRGPTIQ